MGTENQKLKLLYLMQMLYDETDETHGLSTPELIEGLAERGIAAERKAIYRDLEALRAFGLDIARLPTRPATYGLARRTFSGPELMLLTDAVQSSRFLTQRMANRLAAGVASLGSRHQVRSLKKHVHVEGRIKMQNESVFHHVDTIHEALAARRKVAFRYVKYDAEKRPVAQKDGRLYCETPVHLVYSDGFYYLIAYNEKHESFPTYRLDRMQGLRITDEPSARNEAIATFDAEAYSARTFSMFGGEVRRVTLRVEEPVMGALIDRFGKDVETALVEDEADGEGVGSGTIDSGTRDAGAGSEEAGSGAAGGGTRDAGAGSGPKAPRAVRAYVTVAPSPVFFGWLVQFGRSMRIEAPRALADEYAAYLRDILEDYA